MNATESDILTLEEMAAFLKVGKKANEMLAQPFLDLDSCGMWRFFRPGLGGRSVTQIANQPKDRA